MRLLTQKIKYNLKRALPILTIAGAGMMSSCDKSAEDEPKRDVDLEFWQGHYDAVQPENIQKYVNDPSVNKIYLSLTGDGYYENFGGLNIRNMRNYFQERIDLAPEKIRGKGNFNFRRGIADPQDSLWYVQNGWTVNQR